MRKATRMLLVAILGAVTLPFAAQAQPAGTPALREAEDLQAIARDPHHLVALHLGDGAPFNPHRELFDQAFAACRQMLRATPNDNAVRANLGGLYLWRNALHPEESGNFEKAIDQFLIVLSNDPGNVAVLEYLRTYEVLVRVRTELGEQGMTNIESALQHTLKDPPGAANLRAFARVYFFDGRLIEARAAAEALTELSPEPDSYLLLGSIELKMAHADKALTAFQVAQQRARDAMETATAKLGAAEANQALGHTDNADHLLAEAVASLPAQTLEHAARVAGLDTPAELGWAIGKSYMASGEIGKAAEHLGTEGIGYLSSEMASAKNSEGVKLFDESNDPAAARIAFFSAAQLIPMEPVYWRNAAVASFKMGLYQESLVAFRKSAALEALDGDRVFGLGMSYAVLGDYRNAQATFEKAARDFPKEASYADWAVDLAYASGGWDAAAAAWSRLHHSGGGEVSRDDWYDIFVHVRGGMSAIVERSEQRKALYLSLRHQSVLYHILGEGLKRNLLSNESREMIRRERQQAMNTIIDHYRRLPLKPVLPPEVQQLVLRAQPYMDSALQNYDARSKAVDLYEQVIEAAPWWPEGHYTLALLACQNPSMYAYGELSNPDSGWVAGREMNTFLALTPDGPDAARARKILGGCHH
jgi:tetratricopeptide (TPR) repeat protein